MWEHVGIGLVIAFVVFYACKRLRPVAEFVAVSLLVLRRLCQVVQQVDQRIARPRNENQNSVKSDSSGLATISRLVGGAVGVLCLAGEFVGSMQAGAAIFGGTTGVPFEGLASGSAALLFFSLGMVFGIMFLEASDWLPREVQLFVVPPGARRLFRFVAAIGLLGAVIAMALFYALRIFYSEDATAPMTIVLQRATLCGGGLLVVVGGAFALWMMVLGLFALLQTVAQAAGLVAGALSDICELCIRQIGCADLLRGTGMQAKSEIADSTSAPQGKEEPDMDDRNVSVTGVGHAGVRVLKKLADRMPAEVANKVVRASGTVDFNAGVTPVLRLGPIDVSPGLEQRDHIRAHEPMPESGKGPALMRLADRVIEANTGCTVAGAAVIFVIDAEELTFAADMLRETHKKLPLREICVVTEVDDERNPAPRTREGLDVMRGLWNEGVLATTFVFSARSELTQANNHYAGEAKQQSIVASILAMLIGAGTHDGNAPCGVYLGILREWGPFAGFSCGSERLAVIGKARFASFWQVLSGGPAVPLFDMENVGLVCEGLLDKVLTEPSTRMITPAQDETRALILGAVPFLKSVEPQLEAVRERMQVYIARRYAASRIDSKHLVMVRANGEPLELASRPLDKHYAQIVAVFPVASDFYQRNEQPETEGEHLVRPDSAADLLHEREPSKNGSAVTKQPA